MLEEDKNAVLNYLREQDGIFSNSILYRYFRFMADGNIVRIQRLAYTWAVCLSDIRDYEYSPFRYRFCFPDLNDAKRFFNEVERIGQIPTYGWVAARPEGRLLLSKELIRYTDSKDELLLFFRENNAPTIDKLIESGLYNDRVFERWCLDNRQGNARQLSLDEVEFLAYLKLHSSKEIKQ